MLELCAHGGVGNGHNNGYDNDDDDDNRNSIILCASCTTLSVPVLTNGRPVPWRAVLFRFISFYD